MTMPLYVTVIAILIYCMLVREQNPEFKLEITLAYILC